MLDLKTGSVRGRMLLETGKGSFHIHDVLTSGDTILVTDSLDRVLVYSLSSGELKGYAFGGEPSVGATGLMAVENGPGRVAIYNLATLQRQKDLVFSHGIVLKRFSPDGAQLFVLTADLRAHVIAMR